MNKAAIMAITLFMILSSSLAPAQAENKTLTFAVEPTWPPMEYLDSNGQMIGFSLDYFTAVCQELGYTAKFVKIDWDNLFTGLDKGEYDAVVASVTINSERRRTMDFTIPYYIVRQSLIVRADSSLANIRQLKKQRVGTQAGTTATEIVDKIPEVVSISYPEIGEAIEALAKGELDAVVCEDVVGAAFLSQPAYSGRLKTASVINTPGAEELYAAAVKKNNLDVLIDLNEGIKAVKTKGIEAELRGKWFK